MRFDFAYEEDKCQTHANNCLEPKKGFFLVQPFPPSAQVQQSMGVLETHVGHFAELQGVLDLHKAPFAQEER